MTVTTAEIRAGDWMRDLGTLRQVESVEKTDGPTQSVSVRFVGGVDGAYATLSVHEGVPVAVWRAPLSEASSHAQA